MKRKILMTAAVLAVMLLPAGCGPKAYELTEKEESLIVNYSAHVVAKYNRFQTEGLKYVNPDAEEPVSTEESIPETPEPTEEPEETGSGAPAEALDGEDAASETDEAPAMQTATLDQLFGSGIFHITYEGAHLADSYVESTYFAMYPDPGYQYLILDFTVANGGDVSAEADFLSSETVFHATVNGEYTAVSAPTMLTEDFTCFRATLGAGESGKSVLIFQVPVSLTEVNELELVVNTGEDYQVIL